MTGPMSPRPGRSGWSSCLDGVVGGQRRDAPWPVPRVRTPVLRTGAVAFDKSGVEGMRTSGDRPDAPHPPDSGRWSGPASRCSTSRHLDLRVVELDDDPTPAGPLHDGDVVRALVAVRLESSRERIWLAGRLTGEGRALARLARAAPAVLDLAARGQPSPGVVFWSSRVSAPSIRRRRRRRRGLQTDRHEGAQAAAMAKCARAPDAARAMVGIRFVHGRSPWWLRPCGGFFRRACPERCLTTASGRCCPRRRRSARSGDPVRRRRRG